jgi:enoyl-CoA hydratase/carnithine racemase
MLESGMRPIEIYKLKRRDAGWGGTQRLPRLVAEAKALEMFLTAKRVDAVEALRIGLIDKISENPVAESLANYSGNSSSISL